MSMRIVLGLALLGCGSTKSPPPKQAAPSPPTVVTAAPPPDAAIDAPAPPATAAHLAPPQTWEEWGNGTDGPFVMGMVIWTGGEQVEIRVMGTLMYILADEIGRAIKDKPDDPAAAIQGVLAGLNELGGGGGIVWKRK